MSKKSSTSGPAPTTPQPPATALAAARPQRGAIRRELLRIVLRDTLQSSGIPAAWVGAEALAVAGDAGQGSVQVHLLLRHWEPRVLIHAHALQESFRQNVLALDPQAAQWLTGISWQLALPDASVCPPLPPASSWTGQPAREATTKAHLQSMFSARDEEFTRAADAAANMGGQFSVTIPVAQSQRMR